MIDFLTVGGLSYIFILYIWFFPLDLNINIFLAMYLAYIINDPHFLSSYQIFYKNFRDKVTGAVLNQYMQVRYIFAALIVPTTIILYFAYCIATEDVKLLSFSANIMLFFVGWHYTKQSYGMLITLSALKKVFYSAHEKKVFLLNSYVVWITTWLYMNNQISVYPFVGYDLLFFSFPEYLLQISMVLSILLGFYCVFLLVMKCVEEGQYSINGIVGYSTAYIWLFFRWTDPVTYLLIPMFHSLQYLPFVLRYKINENQINFGSAKDQKKVAKETIKFILMALFLGYMGFHGLPLLLDSFVNYNKEIYGPQLFLFLFIVLINIHHYFIDNVLWRKENKDVAAYLFAQVKA